MNWVTLVVGLFFLCGGVLVMLCLWTIAIQRAQMAAEVTLSNARQEHVNRLTGEVASLKSQKDDMEHFMHMAKDSAKRALQERDAIIGRPVFLRQEEALMMAETIGAMLDKAQKN